MSFTTVRSVQLRANEELTIRISLGGGSELDVTVIYRAERV
jgi:hypothetical protein